MVRALKPCLMKLRMFWCPVPVGSLRTSSK